MPRLGLIFRYYLKAFFDKVDERQIIIEGLITEESQSLKDGFSELARDQENARKQMAREHRGLLELFKEVSEHQQEEHKQLIEQLIEVKIRVKAKGDS